MFRPFTDPVLIFAVVVVIILLAPMAMRRMRIPGLVGLIVAGAIVGPSGLHLLKRDFTIELLGTVGLLYLMFSAGLSMDLQQFLKEKSRSISFGLCSFLIPQALGVLVGLYIFDFSLLSSLLLGSIVGSHTLLAFPTAKRLGVAKNRAVTVSLGGTIITDVLSLTVLAIVVALSFGNSSAAFWLQFAGLLVCFLIYVVYFLPRLGKWFFTRVQDRAESDFGFLLVVLFLSAAIAEVVGLAPIVGAFAAGLAMNRLVPDTSTLMNRFLFVGDALFIPFFLISVGMLVDFSVLVSSLEVWWMATVLLALVFFGKGLAAAGAGTLMRFSPAEIFTSIGLTTPQAAATLAVTLVGFELGLFEATTVNAVIILMLFSCFAGTVLVERFGRRVALQEELEPSTGVQGPERILVPLANARTAPGLLALAFLLRNENTDEPIYPLVVARETESVDSEVVRSERLLSQAAIQAASANIPAHPLTRVDLHISSGITRAMQERRITTVVMGWKGEVGASDRILGNIIDDLLEDTDQLIVVHRAGKSPLSTAEKVFFLVPEFAEREVGFPHSCVMVKRLAKQLSAELVVVAREDRVSLLEKTLLSLKPDISLSLAPIRSWSAVTSSVDSLAGENDVVVLHSARVERVSWTPQMDVLPAKLARSLLTQHMLFLYPSERSPEVMASGAIPLKKLVSEDRVALDLPATERVSQLRSLLERHFGAGSERADYIARQFVTMEDSFAIELGDGLHLYHKHVQGLTKSLLLIGRLQGTDESRSVVAILLSPSAVSSEVHIATLGLIARALSRERVGKAIQNASAAAEVVEALHS